MTSKIKALLPIVFACATLPAQIGPGENVDPKTIVKAEVVTSTDPVAAGKTVEVAVVVHIMDGFHMNSHTPSESYLIASKLSAQPPAGISAGEAVYPKGKLATFAFSPDKPLDVYEGTVVLRMPMQVAATAATGPVDVPVTLRYQACNTKACFRPVSLPLTAKVTIAPAGTATHAVRPEVFSR